MEEGVMEVQLPFGLAARLHGKVVSKRLLQQVLQRQNSSKLIKGAYKWSP